MTEKWGRTGRVTLAVERDYDSQPFVEVDGSSVGYICTPDLDLGSGWHAHTISADVEHLPTRDAAVCWVLRRAAPDVWRAERPVVLQLSPRRYEQVPPAMEGLTAYARAEYARTVTR